MTDAEDAPEPRTGLWRRTLLTDGLILALLTALVYATAFAFETGYADRFGYPWSLIEVDLAALLLTGFYLAFAGVVLWMVVHSLMGLLPARHARVILFNPYNFFLAPGLLLLYPGVWGMSGANLGPWWETFLLAFGAFYYFIFYRDLSRSYRKVSMNHPRFLDRYEAATALQVQDLARTPWTVGGTVLASVQRDPAGRRWLTHLFAVATTGLVLFYATNGVGQLYARRQRTYLVAKGPPITLALIRRYGEHVLVKRYDRISRTMLPQLLVLPVIDSSRTWVSTNITHLRVFQTQQP